MPIHISMIKSTTVSDIDKEIKNQNPQLNKMKFLTVNFNIPDKKNSATKFIQFPKNVVRNTEINQVIQSNLK